MKTDMKPQAVTMRLRQTSELRRLCLALGKNNFIANKQESRNVKRMETALSINSDALPNDRGCLRGRAGAR